MGRTVVGVAAFVGYVLTVFGANWAIGAFGIVPIGFGLMAPAGVYFAGLAFGLRDVLQESIGRWAAVAAILAGAALSYFIDPAFALASALAFLASEFADFAVYTPLRMRSWPAAVLLSNTVGAVVDSAIFLSIAFGSLDFITGQVVGKLYMVAPAMLIMYVVRRFTAANKPLDN